jgi:sulfatase modifying factor 1
MHMLRPSLIAILFTTFCVAYANGGDGYVRLPGGAFKSVLSYDDIKFAQPGGVPEQGALKSVALIQVAPFLFMQKPVTNAEFLVFVRQNSVWQRDQAPEVFAEARYLSHWAAPLSLGALALPNQPVVNVSWFAASAYCESSGARLANWSEWEYAAAADETRKDARSDPAWRERILSWYSKPSTEALANVGKSPGNIYGVQDLHGLVWEWPGDYASMLVSSDSRAQSEQDRLKFCGAGAIAMDDRENYAVLMRIALLSSLQAHNVTSSLGFRCARDLPGQAQLKRSEQQK